MKRQKETREPEINRKTYEKVKKYDRQQLNDFCLGFYRLGREDERKEAAAAERPDTGAILEAISQVKGIGPRTFAGVKAVIEEMIGKEE